MGFALAAGWGFVAGAKAFVPAGAVATPEEGAPISFASRLRNAAGAIAPASSLLLAGRSALSGDCQ
jgi:hypothetical protein